MVRSSRKYLEPGDFALRDIIDLEVGVESVGQLEGLLTDVGHGRVENEVAALEGDLVVEAEGKVPHGPGLLAVRQGQGHLEASNANTGQVVINCRNCDVICNTVWSPVTASWVTSPAVHSSEMRANPCCGPNSHGPKDGKHTGTPPRMALLPSRRALALTKMFSTPST